MAAPIKLRDPGEGSIHQSAKGQERQDADPERQNAPKRPTSLGAKMVSGRKKGWELPREGWCVICVSLFCEVFLRPPHVDFGYSAWLCV